PRTIFDTTLPIWRMGEALLHARNLAGAIADDPHATKVQFRALYTGLSGRVLRSWANPLTDLFVKGSGASRSDEAALEISASVHEIEDDLGKVLHPMVASLFERFGVTGLPVDWVRTEVERLKQGRFNVRS
ncbi:MAG TPA: transcriptional regulator, partial [Beijerinckiaceae bacterium]|nr:transcriptional regulator [Beijerinckiaceae bacterium]